MTRTARGLCMLILSPVAGHGPSNSPGPLAGAGAGLLPFAEAARADVGAVTAADVGSNWSSGAGGGVAVAIAVAVATTVRVGTGVCACCGVGVCSGVGVGGGAVGAGV